MTALYDAPKHIKHFKYIKHTTAIHTLASLALLALSKKLVSLAISNKKRARKVNLFFCVFLYKFFLFIST